MNNIFQFYRANMFVLGSVIFITWFFIQIMLCFEAKTKNDKYVCFYIAIPLTLYFIVDSFIIDLENGMPFLSYYIEVTVSYMVPAVLFAWIVYAWIKNTKHIL